MGVLVGKKAPNLKGAAVLGTGEIVDDYNFKKATEGKVKVVFFYPLDFTFVCPSELIAFDKRMDEFTKRGVEVVAVSIDSQFTHNAWRNTPINEGGIGPVKYTMFADVTHKACRKYGVETLRLTASEISSENKSFRDKMTWLKNYLESEVLSGENRKIKHSNTIPIKNGPPSIKRFLSSWWNVNSSAASSVAAS